MPPTPLALRQLLGWGWHHAGVLPHQHVGRSLDPQLGAQEGADERQSFA